MKRKNMLFSAVVSAIIFILVNYAWILMFTQADGQTLSQRGFASLKYFTVLSNLLMGFAALVHLICSIQVLRKKTEKVPEWAEQLFYTGTTAVSLTFGMVMVYLGPIFGYGKLLENFQLYLHLFVPVLSILTLCLLHRERVITQKDSFTALFPLFFYGIYYLGMIFRFGLDRPKADWYYLAVGGMRSIPFVFLLIVLCTWGIALMLRLAVNGIKRK